ncbi:MAG: sce7726 family protein [Actinomycetota bacterium]
MSIDRTPTSPLSAAADLFSSATYRDLASIHPIDAVERLRNIIPLAMNAGAETIGEAFDAAYEALLQEYRNEYIFKNTIVSKIIYGRHKPTTASAILELPLGRSFADVVIFNGTSTVYEIKTDLDTFARLPNQLKEYCTRVEFIYVVVSEKRIANASARLPEGVGLIALRSNGSLRVVREPTSNLDLMRADHIFKVLRQSEAINILNRYGLHPQSDNAVERWYEILRLFSELDVERAHKGAVDVLRARATKTRKIASHSSLPKSARALAYSATLSDVGAKRLASRFALPIAALRNN